MLALATIGPAALYLLFIWLLSAAGAAWLAQRKGYTERVGLMFGLILSVVGLIIMLLLPGRPGSTWKLEGPLPNPGARRPLGLSALGPLAGTDEASEPAGPALPDSLGGSDIAGEGPSSDEPPASEPPQRD